MPIEHAGDQPGQRPEPRPAHFNADGLFTYKPNTDYNGSDFFDYRICDNGSPQNLRGDRQGVYHHRPDQRL